MADVAINRGPQRSALAALIPLVFDVVVPVGLYYLLSALGVADTPALIVSGLVPFARSVRSLAVERKVDYLAVMMAGLFILSLVLVAVTGGPRFVLAKESFGSGLIGTWCLRGAPGRPARSPSTPLVRCLPRGNPRHCGPGTTSPTPPWRSVPSSSVWPSSGASGCSSRPPYGSASSSTTRSTPRRGSSTSPRSVIIVALCVATGPLGGVRLQRLLAAELAVGAEGESS